MLNETAAALGTTTAPQLRTTWFSATYWRMTAIAAVLTLPFLFAAAVQALIRSDLGLLARAAFGYLPLAMLAIAIAAPLTMLLLAATDELCAFISSAAGDASAHFLAKAGLLIGGLTALTSSPFLAFLVGLFMVGAAFALWIELLMREAAVYVIVLMLPLAFAAMVWPARRVWAVRAVELLVALIMSKFAIVAVLSLGGAAISSGADHGSVTAVMAGAVLIMLAAFSPWALLRVIPLAELASGAAGTLRAELGRANRAAGDAWARAHEWSDVVTAAMRRDAADGGADPAPLPQHAPGLGAGGPGGGGPGGGDPRGGGTGGGPAEPPGDGRGGSARNAGRWRPRAERRRSRTRAGRRRWRALRRTPAVPARRATRPPRGRFNWDDEPVLELGAENLFATPVRLFDDAPPPVTGERLTYRFGPLERRGILGQLRGGQAAAVASGALAAIVALDRAPTAAGAFLGILFLAGALLAAFAPVGRRTADEWIPVAVSFGTRWIRGRLRFRSGAPAGGMLAAERPGPLRRLVRHPAPDAPAALKGVRIVEAPYRDHPVGVLVEHRGRRLTAVLACRVLAFSLLDRRGAGAAPRALGADPRGRGGRRGQETSVDRAHGSRPGRRARALACTTSAIPRSRCGARRSSNPISS